MARSCFQMHANNRSLSNVRVDIVIKHWYESIPTLLDREKNVVHVFNAGHTTQKYHCKCNALEETF